ncbi:hypothetical protein RhiirA4_507299 [Rhizophagus irregularis]|uniref:Uncharacterized protein n=1 Tax=Rhizophagus irregularis TaxID=588596 RepID=A0A2I1HC57_9GLOM|nr:hypothetical protein RhiirA4_507299 [Rhizophagus irregularis]
MNVNWAVPEFLIGVVGEFFFRTPWYKWFLIEYLQFKKAEILAGLSKTVAHHDYKKSIQQILETKPPEDISLAIMKQLTTKIQDGEEVKQFWKLITVEKKYTEQLKAFRDSAEFETDVLKVRNKRFIDEIDSAIERDAKRKELDMDNEYNTPTCTRIDNVDEKANDEEYVSADKEETAFWVSNNQKSKIESLITPHKPILTRQMFHVLSTKVIPGLKSLKSVVAMRYPEIADEIENHEQEQKRLSSLGLTLTEWLRVALSSSSPEKLLECLMKPLQGEQVTDREKKLHDIFELTLREFHTMIKYNPRYSLPRHNSERKFLVERVATPFKLIEYVFGNVTTYWIEKEILSTKAMEFIDDPTGELTKKKVDALATDFIYNTDVMNLESSGGPLQQDRKHTLGDSDKISNTGVDILLQCLRKYLGASIETAKKLKSYSIQIIEDRITLIEVSLYKPRVCKEVEVRNAVFPFALSSIGEYMRVFELVSYYVDGLLSRQEIMQELSMEANGIKEVNSENLKDWWIKE